MNPWRIALRSFRDLCAFVGLIVLVSYFYNWTADIRHWYVTLASAFVCSVLWFGFYVLETHGDAVRRSSVPARSFREAHGNCQVSQGGGEEPRWRHYDKELFYSSPDVFTYSVDGCGQRFLVNTIIDEPNAMPLSITLNWAEKVKEKEPSRQVL